MLARQRQTIRRQRNRRLGEAENQRILCTVSSLQLGNVLSIPASGKVIDQAATHLGRLFELEMLLVESTFFDCYYDAPDCSLLSLPGHTGHDVPSLVPRMPAFGPLAQVGSCILPRCQMRLEDQLQLGRG